MRSYSPDVESYGPDTDIWYMCTITLTLEIWPWFKVMVLTRVIDNNCVKYYPDPTWQWLVMTRIRSFGMYALWPWPWRYDLGSRFWHHCIMYNNCVKYPDPTWQWGVMARTQILGLCAMWRWPWRYDIKSRSCHTFESWTTIVWNIQIGQVGTKLLVISSETMRTDKRTGRSL